MVYYKGTPYRAPNSLEVAPSISLENYNVFRNNSTHICIYYAIRSRRLFEGAPRYSEDKVQMEIGWNTER
jgi:hypothetical protein